jgi:hypothetical protein
MMEGYIAAVEAAKVWGCEGPPWYQLIYSGFTHEQL